MRPATVPNGVQGARRAAAHRAGAAGVGRRRRPAVACVLAGPRSFCAGVDRAIEIVELALQRYQHPVYVRRQIVHNAARRARSRTARCGVRRGAGRGARRHHRRVLRPRRGARGARRGRRAAGSTSSTPPARWWPRCTPRPAASSPAATPCCSSATTVTTRPRARSARCRAASTLVQTPADAERVQAADPERVSFLMQTTLAVDDAADTVDVLRRRFPLIESSATDDICYATTNRQHAVRAIAADSDLVLVVGSTNSSNSAAPRRGRRARRAAGPPGRGRDRRAARMAARPPARSASPRGRPRRRISSTSWSAPCRPSGADDVDRTGPHHRGRPIHPPEGSHQIMPVPVRQAMRISKYLLEQKIRRRDKFPLIVELEPLFACNLACNGCGKIQHPHDILRQRMPVEAGRRRGRGMRARRWCRSPAASRSCTRRSTSWSTSWSSARSTSTSAPTPSWCASGGTSSTSSPRRTSRSPSTSTACASGTTSRCRRRACSTRRSRRSTSSRPRVSASPPTRRSSTPTPRRRSST